MSECESCNGTGDYLDRENRFIRPCSDCNHDAGVESLDELPDHPNDRVWPGFKREFHIFLNEKIIQYHQRMGRQLHGFIAAATSRLEVQAPEAHDAMTNALKTHNPGDLESFAIDVDACSKPKNHFEVQLIGAGRFYMWGDGADIGEVAPQIIHTGDYSHCGVVTNWLARMHEVDNECLCIEREYMKQVLQRENCP